MSPLRQKWWDSLPAEEKRVRRDIKELRTQIVWHKICLNSSCGHETEMRKFALCMNKRIIKALRKQIAMRPIVFKYPGYESCECPRCRVGAITYFPHCPVCGQKLR